MLCGGWFIPLDVREYYSPIKKKQCTAAVWMDLETTTLSQPDREKYITHMWNLGFPGATSGKEPACQCRRHKRHMFDPWVRKIPWRRVWQSTPVFLPGESHGRRRLASYSP